jgi:bacillithiol system protein YtxJ
MINECRSEEDFHRLLEDSRSKPVFLFKHSTACPTSKGARMKYETLSEEDQRAEYWLVLVRENKALARQIAEESGVEHQSPQVILFRDGRAIWNCAHYAINNRVLSGQLDDLET